MSFDCSRYQVPFSNSIAGYRRWPVCSCMWSRLARLCGPGARSYSIPMSCSAFSIFQQGCALIFTHWPEHRCSFTAISSSSYACLRQTDLPPSGLRRKEREVGLALAAEEGEVDLDAP